jgi:hypothetical protein
MKWFLIELWHFVTTSNILGVVFGLVLGTWWKRYGKLEIEHIPDRSLFSENELPHVEKIDRHAILVNIFNQKDIAVFLTKFDMERDGRHYKVRRKRADNKTEADILKIDACSAKTFVFTCETVPQEGDVIRVYVHKRKRPIMFKIK